MEIVGKASIRKEFEALHITKQYARIENAEDGEL